MTSFKFQFTFAICASVANWSGQLANQYCNIASQYCNVARKRTSGLTVKCRSSPKKSESQYCNVARKRTSGLTVKCRSSPKKSELVLLIEEDNKVRRLSESQQHEELERMRREKWERERRVSEALRKLYAERDASREYERRELREAIRLGSMVRLDVGFSD